MPLQDKGGSPPERSLFANGPFGAYWHALDVEKVVNQQIDLFTNLSEIALGTSKIEPDKKDRRFDDEAWTVNPFYSRLKQTYLAMSDAAAKMIPDDLPQDDKARAELATSIFTSALSPTNTLLGNPAAISKTMESGGENLRKGYDNYLRDLHENSGMPAQVDNSDFEVGRNLAVTPGKVILRTELFELIQYAPSTETVHAIPVLLIPPQIGRFYFTDLAPGRSFAEYTVSQGLQYFAISWRNPTPADRDWGLERYFDAVLEAVEAVKAITETGKVNLVGFCAGGIMAAIVTSWLRSKGQDMVNSFTSCVTMLDFASDSSIGAFRLPMALTMAESESRKKGILPGEQLSMIFAWLRPNELVWNYWVNNYLMGEEPPAFDILAWNKDSTNLPAQLHQDFIAIFRSNGLASPGAFTLRGAEIDVSKIDCDSFVVGAVTDHLTPWQACYKTARMLGGTSTFALSNGGHVAALVNPPGNAKAFHYISGDLADEPDAWLRATEKRGGSWWESWTDWAAARSGDRIPAAKTLGSKKYPPLADAPGDYVREPSNRS